MQTRNTIEIPCTWKAHRIWVAEPSSLKFSFPENSIPTFIPQNFRPPTRNFWYWTTEFLIRTWYRIIWGLGFFKSVDNWHVGLCVLVCLFFANEGLVVYFSLFSLRMRGWLCVGLFWLRMSVCLCVLKCRYSFLNLNMILVIFLCCQT